LCHQNQHYGKEYNSNESDYGERERSFRALFKSFSRRIRGGYAYWDTVSGGSRKFLCSCYIPNEKKISDNFLWQATEQSMKNVEK
jgi:hypothetical protein